MSHVETPDGCYCSCHQPGSFAMHVVPCCDGACDHCGRRIARGRMTRHLQVCAAWPDRDQSARIG